MGHAADAGGELADEASEVGLEVLQVLEGTQLYWNSGGHLVAVQREGLQERKALDLGSELASEVVVVEVEHHHVAGVVADDAEPVAVVGASAPVGGRFPGSAVHGVVHTHQSVSFGGALSNQSSEEHL